MQSALVLLTHPGVRPYYTKHLNLPLNNICMLFIFSLSCLTSPHWHLLLHAPSFPPITSLPSWWYSMVLCDSPSLVLNFSLTPPSFQPIFSKQGSDSTWARKKKVYLLTTVGSWSKNTCGTFLSMHVETIFSIGPLLSYSFNCWQTASGRLISYFPPCPYWHNNSLGIESPVIYEMWHSRTELLTVFYHHDSLVYCMYMMYASHMMGSERR